jgi:2-polyprenyl-3-methyl-5-hydroxy-6-metoxy-1,4-benzoquinol methylase
MIHFYYERANSFMAPKVYEFIQMFRGVELKKDDVILDLGCGDGSLPLAIGKFVKKVVGVDTLPRCIKDATFKAKEVSEKITAEFYYSKLEDAGFQEKSFDKVVSFSVIEHIPNYVEVLEEVFKLLKDDGELIISVDSFSHFDKELRDIHQQKFEVEKYFEKNELYELLKNVGFREVSIEPIFKSKLAEKWFVRVLNNPGEYFGTFKRLYSFLLYYIIGYHEKKVKQQDHGIFLIARCKK